MATKGMARKAALVQWATIAAAMTLALGSALASARRVDDSAEGPLQGNVSAAPLPPPTSTLAPAFPPLRPLGTASPAPLLPVESNEKGALSDRRTSPNESGVRSIDATDPWTGSALVPRVERRHRIAIDRVDPSTGAVIAPQVSFRARINIDRLPP